MVRTKAGTDKLAHDMAVDFRPHGVAVISLDGLLATGAAVVSSRSEKYAGMADNAESEFSGRVIDALARDPQLMSRSGQVWIAAELAAQYGVTDIDGRQPVSPRAYFGDTTCFGDAVVE